jgi:hypothetical protein
MKKNYRYSNFVMLQASLIICGFFLELIDRFKEYNMLYTSEYGSLLKKRIEAGINLVAVDIRSTQRNATRTVVEIVDDARGKLVSFFTSLTNAYRNDKTMLATLKRTLGYDAFMKKMQNYNQEAAIQFVNAFTVNILQYRDDIIAKGIPAIRMDEISGFGKELLDANVAQESEKEKSIQLTAEQQTEFNAIYTEVIAICKEGQNIFKSDAAMRSRFVFDTIVAGFGGTRNSDEPEEDDEPEQPAK